VLSILWDKLKHSSTPLVLASIKIILKFTERKEELFRNIVEKIKAPLITLMTGNENSGSYETMFVVLQHIEYVIVHMRGKNNFEKDFKYFYVKADEPSYIKALKVRILGELANEYNLGDLLNELNDYATDVDPQMARKSVQTLTRIALALPEVSKALLVNINSYYRLGQAHLANEVVLSFYQILRKYPKLLP
jgi:AP-4 complex subunit beta-1